MGRNKRKSVWHNRTCFNMNDEEKKSLHQFQRFYGLKKSAAIRRLMDDSLKRFKRKENRKDEVWGV